jgi:hypothetical protein
MARKENWLPRGLFTKFRDLAKLLKLRCISKKGGLLYLIFMDDATSDQHRQHTNNVFYQLALNSNFYQEYEVMKVVEAVFGRSFNSYVYFRINFLRAKLSKWFELLAVGPQGFGTTQTVYLLRKRA